MKRKTILPTFIIFVAILAISLTGCLRLSLEFNKITQKMRAEGFDISYVIDTEWTTNTSGEELTIYKLVEINKNDGVNTFSLIMYECDTDVSAEWVEEKCKERAVELDVPEKDFITYRFETLVLFGDYRTLALARGY